MTAGGEAPSLRVIEVSRTWKGMVQLRVLSRLESPPSHTGSIGDRQVRAQGF